MSRGTAAQPPLAELAAFLRGERVGWSALGLTAAGLLDLCETEEITALLHQRLRHAGGDDWPPSVHEELERGAHAAAARELLRRREVTAVLDTLAAAGVYPIVLKGTALAYSVYDAPFSRPRADTDLFISQHHIDTVRRRMATLGYSATPYCDEVFSQFELARIDAYGVDHAFDFHWKISTQSTFADLLEYDQLASRSIALPALGSHCRTACRVDALLLACVHPVMHHRNVERLIWTYDIHLLASRLSDHEFGSLAMLAIGKRVAAIVAHELTLARSRFGTRIPQGVLAKLEKMGTSEPSAVYLRDRRRWHDELASNLRGLPSWQERFRHLRDVLLPSPSYVLSRYGVTPRSPGALLLPALYLHRAAHGLVKVLAGRK